MRHPGVIAIVGLLATLNWTVAPNARGRLSQGGVFQRADAFGCAKPEDYIAIKAQLGASRAASDELRDRLVRDGACAYFVQGEPFTIEEEGAEIVCLRPQSERDCLWSGRVSIGD